MDGLITVRVVDPAIYLLIGFPGTGKYTVAQALMEELTLSGSRAKVIDNHYVNNPIFGVIEADGVSPLPDGVWPLVDQVRDAILTAVEQLAPPSYSFVFTNYITEQDAAGGPIVPDYLRRLELLAQSRGTTLRIVRLTCELDELCRRITQPDRQQRLKTVSAAWVRDEVDRQLLFTPTGGAVLTLDISALPPAEAARTIAKHPW
jgi:hypothetical protein